MARTSPPRPVVATVVVACVVAVAAQVAAAVLGSDTSDGREHPPAPDCGGQPCRVLATTVVNGMSVELLADRAGTTGRLRAGNGAVDTVTRTGLADEGGHLTGDSLRCAASPAPVCLVRGPGPRGMVGELHVWRGDAWQRRSRTVISDAGMVALDDVLADPMPEIVAARRACGVEVGTDGGDETDDADGADGADAADGADGAATGCDGRAPAAAPAVAEVLDIHGRSLGCTEPRRRPEELRGWPELEVRATDLRPCPSGASMR